MGNQRYTPPENTRRPYSRAIAVTATRPPAEEIAAKHDGYEVFEITPATFVVGLPDQSHYVAPETSSGPVASTVESPHIGGRAGYARRGDRTPRGRHIA